MNFEQAAVEVRHLTQDRLEIRRALRGLLPQALVKQPEEEVAVKAQKLVLPLPLQDHLEAVLKVPSIAIKESFLLNEIDEHQPVEHERGVPLPVSIDWDALDELQEVGVFLLELVVELLGDLVAVECVAQGEDDPGEGQSLLGAQGKRDQLEFLDQGVPGLSGRAERVLAVRDWLPGLRATHCQIWVDFAASMKMIRCS